MINLLPGYIELEVEYDQRLKVFPELHPQAKEYKRNRQWPGLKRLDYVQVGIKTS